MARITEADN